MNKINGKIDSDNEQQERQCFHDHATPRDELINHHLGLGSYIRNEFGLWQEESELLHSLTPGSSPEDPDDASLTILEALWTRLQR